MCDILMLHQSHKAEVGMNGRACKTQDFDPEAKNWAPLLVYTAKTFGSVKDCGVHLNFLYIQTLSFL